VSAQEVRGVRRFHTPAWWLCCVRTRSTLTGKHNDRVSSKRSLPASTRAGNRSTFPQHPLRQPATLTGRSTTSSPTKEAHPAALPNSQIVVLAVGWADRIAQVVVGEDGRLQLGTAAVERTSRRAGVSASVKQTPTRVKRWPTRTHTHSQQRQGFRTPTTQCHARHQRS
jgi:ribosomal protein L21